MRGWRERRESMGVGRDEDTPRQHPPAWMRRAGRLARRTLLGGFIFAYAGLVVVPFVWVLLTSFKAPEDVHTNPPRWLFEPTLDNYREVLFARELDFAGALRNSIVVTVASTGISLAIGGLAAYSVSRLPLPMKGGFSFFFLVLRMLPSIALMIPIYLLLQRMDQLDKLSGLILVYTAFNTPLAIWILRGFFADLPREIEESALIDGCTRFESFLRVTLPLSLPGLAATAAISALWIWNDFVIAFVFSRRDAVTLIVLASRFQEEWGPRWGQIAATAIIAIVPAFLFSMLLQRHIVRGLLGGSLKG